MRSSQLLIATLKETPADAEVISHQLMLRAGMIRKLASGLYTWLPLGLKTLRKVERIIREEMDKSGAQEVLMPVVQDAGLWQETGRWEKYGAELLRFKDRHERDFVLGPTHEEVITDMVRREVRSYKQLPMNFYQIQTKFRDEIRPRFGVMRSREFIMKDAYSFHLDRNSLAETYQVMYATYSAIFTRMGLDFRPVLADNGSIGGDSSHEFHVLASSGEDAIVFDTHSDYAANLEKASAAAPGITRPGATLPLTKVATPHIKTIDQVAEFFCTIPQTIVKTLLVKGSQTPAVALVLRGDHSLNEIKAEHLEAVAAPLTLLSDSEIQNLIGCLPGSIGVCGLSMPIIVDRDAAVLADFITGANEEGMHFTGCNWERDANYTQEADIRNVEVGDQSPVSEGYLQIARGIEVGHIFQLGTSYSQAMKAEVLDENGKALTLEMGCYGIGVTRVVAAAIEQNHDDNGIIWPAALAPFEVVIVPMNMAKFPRVAEVAEQLYTNLKAAGIDVVLDDRKERPGVMFADWDLIGVPYRIVIGERNLDEGQVEFKERRSSEVTLQKISTLVTHVKSLLA